jgi:hypothetical protein
VRARNLDGCGAQITASLRDPYTKTILGFDERPIDLDPEQDGWGWPRAPEDIASFANLPACPSAAASRGIDGQRYTLEVSVRDRNSRVASAALDVVPSCVETQTCPRECSGGAR